MAKSKKEESIEKMLKKEIGKDRINISISKYERLVGPLPKVASLRGNSALKTFAKHNGYDLRVGNPEIYLIKKS